MDATLNQLSDQFIGDSESIFNAMPEPAFLLSGDGVYLNAFGGKDSQRYHDPSVLIGKSLFDIFLPESANRFLAYVRQVIETGNPVTHEYQLDASTITVFQDKDGPVGMRYFEGYLSRVEGKNKQYAVLWTARCITAYKDVVEKLTEQKSQLKSVSQRDHLTGVYNRVALENILPGLLKQACRSHKSVTAFMVDIDFFKQLNEKFGHIEGDRALVRLGNILKQHFSSDCHCFRYGGDEFLVILTGYSLEHVQIIAENFRKAVHKASIPNPDSPVTPHLTVTVGVYYNPSPTDHLCLEELIYLADKALFNAKSDNKNTVFVI